MTDPAPIQQDLNATCAVCGKVVAISDHEEHISSNHLGPHYFWFNAQKFRTMKPSMTIRDLRSLFDVPILYLFIQDRNGAHPGAPDRMEWGSEVAVDLTREPHFFSVPPATMWAHHAGR